MKYLVLMLVLLTNNAYGEADDSHVLYGAEELHLLEPTDVYTDLYKYRADHDAYLSPIDTDISQGASFNISMNLLRWNHYALHWKNNLYFDQSRVTQQIVHAGYHYELGINLVNDSKTNAPRIELFKEHNSEHVMDSPRPVHFPVYDRYGVRLRIYP